MLPSVIVLLTLLSCTHGENPAVQFTLNNKGLQYGKHMGAGWIQEKLGRVTLPDISGKAVGIEYTLTGLSVQKCDFPEPSVQFSEIITGFNVSISGLNIALSGGWRTHLGLIHDSGSLDMAVFNVDVASVVEVDKDPNGRLSVSSFKCGARVGDVNMQFHGGASWIFKPFVHYYINHIRGEIQSRICPGVQQCIEQLEGHLQAMNVSFDVAEALTFYYPLTDSPVSDGSSLNLGFKGEFTSFNTTKDPPFQPQPFTMSKQPDYMLTVGLSEYTLNSASYGYFLDGLLQVFINDSMIPKICHVHLNTSSMGKYIPELPKKYPGLLMNLLVYATEAPVFSLQAGAVKLGAQAAIKATAIGKNGTQIPLFKLKLETTFRGKIWTAGGKLKGSVIMDNLTLTVVSTEVGPVKTDVLVKNATSVMTKFVLPQLNLKLGLGMMLPRMKNAQLVNSVLKMEEGFIALSSDAKVYLPD